MDTKKDRNGRQIVAGSRVKWVGANIHYTREDHRDGYKDVMTGNRGHIVDVNHRAGPEFVLIRFNGHTKPVSLGVGGIEVV